MGIRTKIIVGTLTVLILAGISIYFSNSNLFKGSILGKMGEYVNPTGPLGTIEDLADYVEVPASVKNAGYISNPGVYTFKVKEAGKAVKLSVASGKGQWQKVGAATATPPDDLQGGEGETMIEETAKVIKEIEE